MSLCLVMNKNKIIIILNKKFILNIIYIINFYTNGVIKDLLVLEKKI